MRRERIIYFIIGAAAAAAIVFGLAAEVSGVDFGHKLAAIGALIGLIAPVVYAVRSRRSVDVNEEVDADVDDLDDTAGN